MMIKCTLLLVYGAICWAQTPQPCSSPAQWEGRRIMQDRQQNFRALAKYSYDAQNLRTRSIEEIDAGKETDYFDVLHLYKENTEYRLNLRTRKCNVTVPSRPFFPTQVPTGSKLVFEAEVGAAGIPGEHLTAQSWDITFSDAAKYTISVTSPDCVPIWSAYYSESFGLFIENFFDIHAGISDPTIWIPPSECTGL